MAYTIDKCTGGTASAESTLGSNTPAKAFDDTTTGTSFWTSDMDIPAWIKYDFGSGVAWPITRVRVYVNDYFGYAGCDTLKIEGSNNDTDWTELQSSIAVVEGQWNTIDFSNTTDYRYIRVTGLTNAETTYISFIEIEMMYDDVAGSPSSSVSSSESASLSPSSSFSPSSSESLSPSSSDSLSISPSSSESSSPSESVEENSISIYYWSPTFFNEKDYTRGDYVALPTNDNDLKNIYSTQDYTDVSTDNDVRVDQTAIEEYSIHEFKDYMGDNYTADITCNLQTDLAPSSSTVYLQIYNHNTTTWDTIDSDNSSSANTDFTLSANIADLTNYKDGDNLVSCRVYQLGI